jgi:hypothetical protein
MTADKKKVATITNNSSGHASNAVYFFGFVGAAIYYFQQADAFWPYVLGFLKALVWPAILVYKFLESLA